jgi:transmembrane sensor
MDVHLDAQAWVRKLHSGPVTAWEAGAFQRWMEAQPQRRAAFQEAMRQWQLMGAAGAQLLRADAALARQHRALLQRQHRPGRRAFLGFAVGGAGAAMVAAYAPMDLWPSFRVWGADERTAAGEQRTLDFASQVQVALNTRTSVRRVAAGAQSLGGLELIEGETAVEVPAASVPFNVWAGPGHISASAASFEVRHLGQVSCVTCVQGQVRVDHPAGQRLLGAGQQLRYNATRISGITTVRTQDWTAWRRGELVFQQTPLPTVIEEINRYRSGRVVLADDAVRRKTVTARIKVNDIETALLQIQHSFRLRATSLPSHILILS